MKNIVLFGPPGSGKGTQAATIVSKYNLVHLSTGDMLRAEIADKTELGLKAKTLMDRGELVPDAVVIGMIDNKLKANPKAAGFIFDGFPRTVAQAEALDQLLSAKGAPINKVLSLKVSEEELTKRILERGKTSGRTDDQDENIVKNRVVEYRNKTAPLAAYYEKQGKLVEIPGEGTIDHIADLLAYELDNIANGSTAGTPSLFDRIFHPHKDEPKKEEAKPAETPIAEAAHKVTDVIKKAVKAVAEKVEAPEKKAAPKKAAAKPAAKKAPAKAAAPKKAASPAKAAKKATPKKAAAVVKKAAKKVTPKKAVKKAAKKAAPKKVAKKVAPKKVVKAVKKAAKKVAPKKVVKAVKKVAKKVAPKKVVKKAAPKKVAKKAAPKKAVKAIKKVAKKVAPKKVVKKAAPKKAVKAVKKAVKKVAPKKVAKKAVKKVAVKKKKK
ncbi:MAG: adenylate kinase [Bacteroidetes bacterium]|nr:adenylate kinase [Bacteroidota bacterium]